MAKTKPSDDVTPQGILDETGEGFTFDMSSQPEDTGYPVLPKGTYAAVIDNVEYQISKNSGNPMWKVTHAITEESVAGKNLKMFSYVVFKPDQMGRVKTFLLRLGRGDLAASSTFNPKQVADDKTLCGIEHRVKLDIRKSDEYGDSNEVKAVLGAAGGGGASGAGGFSM